MKKALTIAGFDPSGGAGLQADLKVFQALGVYGLSAVAALTAQNSQGVEGAEPVSKSFLKKQLEVLFSDIIPDATKMGMLLSGDNVKAVAALIKKYTLKNVLLDPVMISTSGKRLADRDVPRLLREKILPLCAVITPNMHEASVLSSMRISSLRDMEKAAVILRAAGPETVIVTGGHLEGNATDLLYDGSFHYLKARKRHGEYHGTGCVFSAAVTAYMAGGHSGLAAAKKAKKFMTEAFRKTISTGHGMKLFAV